MWHVGFLRGPWDCFFFFFTVYGQLWMYRHHFARMLCLSVYVTLFKGGSGRRKADRVKACSWSYIPLSLSFSFFPGGTRWRVCWKDRLEITSVMSARAKVCQTQTSLPRNRSLSVLFPPPLFCHLYSLLSISLSLLICHQSIWNHHLCKLSPALSFFISTVQATINQGMTYV